MWEEDDRLGGLDLLAAVVSACWSWGRSWKVVGGGQVVAVEHLELELLNGDSLQRVEFKNPLENHVQLGGDWENSLKEIWVLHESPESRVLVGSFFPWVASTGQVDQDDTETPDIVWCASIISVLRSLILALCWQSISTNTLQGVTSSMVLPGDI